MSNKSQNSLFSTDVTDQCIDKVVFDTYMKYAVDILVSRSLPDVRDGLKEVNRRILYAMYDNNVTGNNYSKSASVIGEVIGKYHPHGDEAAYGSLVRMAQHWNMKCNTVTGQGNFGCPGENSAAAKRYTEVVLSNYGRGFFKDFNKNTVNMIATYDQKRQEPAVLPACMPNLLINGTIGIGIGLSTSIAPHNPRELLNGLIAILQARKLDQTLNLEEIMRYIPGPDFPNNVSISDYKKIQKIYETGEGSITIYSDYTIDKNNIIFNSIPYGTSKEEIIMQLIDCKERGILPISGISDESTGNIRIVIKIQNNYDITIVKNLIYKHTKLRHSFSNKWFALDSQGVPRQYNLLSYLSVFLETRQQIIITNHRYRLYEYKKDLAKALSFLIARTNMSIIIDLIRQSSSKLIAKEKLMKLQCSIPAGFNKNLLDISTDYYFLSSEQADYILALQLIQIAQFEQDKLIKKITQIKEEINQCLDLLNNKTAYIDYMIKEYEELLLQYKTPRITHIYDVKPNDNPISFVEKEDVIVILDQDNYIKKIPVTHYKLQKTGGKGSTNTTKSPSKIQLKSNTHNNLLFCFQNVVKQLPVYILPTTDRNHQGRALINVISDLDPKDTVVQIINLDLKKKYILFIYSNGVVRKNLTTNFAKINRTGKKYNNQNSATLLNVVQANDDDDLLLGTRQGYHLITAVNQFNTIQSRIALGVTGIKLRSEDRLISSCVIANNTNGYVCVLSRKGKGKLNTLESLGRRNKGSKGCKIIKLTKQDYLFGIFYVQNPKDTHIIITTKQNRTIRVCADSMPVYTNLTTVGNNIVQFDSKNPITSVQLISDQEVTEV